MKQNNLIHLLSFGIVSPPSLALLPVLLEGGGADTYFSWNLGA